MTWIFHFAIFSCEALGMVSWLYLAGIKDIFTCEIVGCALGERTTMDLVGKALFQAVITKRPLPRLPRSTGNFAQN
jgi:transposase InsO family protein